ncbi:hypothetical protein DF143_12540 [Burkholderia cenocepacia]|nr:hypothetical protein DF143_12540 [Burkholderia cenocepacia]RQV45376.1 hypothetical protein DF033_14230 [Burkholderia cenocepacia]
MSHPAAHGVVPGMWLAAAGSDCRARIRPHANARPRRSAPTGVGIDAAPRSRPSNPFFHPIRHSLIQP